MSETRGSESNKIQAGDTINLQHGWNRLEKCGGGPMPVLSVTEHNATATCKCGAKFQVPRTAAYPILNR